MSEVVSPELAAQPEPTPLAHQFDSLAQQNHADDLGMWVFLATEVMFFGGMFLGYTIYRWEYAEAFAAASSHLDLFWGTLNTAILLSSSFSVAMAVSAAEWSRRGWLIGLLGATMALGAAFLGIKFMSYYHEYREGLMPLLGLPFVWEGDYAGEAAMFFNFYFVLTGVHATHMLIGLGAMMVLLIKAMRGGLLGEYSAPVRIVGLYWHFVDIIWVFLFPLLYLVGAR